MFEFFKNMINQSDFELTSMLERITAVYADGRLTTEEFSRLKSMAAEKANPIASLAPLEERFDVILQKLSAIEDRLTALESAGTEPAEPGEDEEPAEPTIPEWVQPLGAYDAYKTGDRVTYQGKVYESTIDGNVWAPDAYPAGWKEITETETETTEEE